jgi:phenylpyruvate tautomerase PptA (4-oxalocrotonate tautomerase family)
MPLYRCLVPAGSLDADTRAALAEEITTIHCSVITASPMFVNVVFTEYEPTAYYVAGQPGTRSVISATIRAGFDSVTRGDLLTRLSQAWSRITGEDIRHTMVYIDETDPASMMEAGLLAPVPGEEAVWVRHYQQELGELRHRG